MTMSHTSAALQAPMTLLVAVAPAAFTYSALLPLVFVRDTVLGGDGRVSGNTKIKGVPDYAVRRRVRLFRERDGLLVREQWSNPTTGAYSFDYIDRAQTYTVVSYDYEHNFRAVVADNLTADPMP